MRKRALNTKPPSARGSVCGWPAGLLTRGALPAAFPACRPVASWREASPLTAAGPSRTCTGFPHRPPRFRPSLSWARDAAPPALVVASRRPLGGGHLRLLLDSEPEQRARNGGHDPAQ